MERDMSVTMILAQFELEQKNDLIQRWAARLSTAICGASVEPVQAKGLALGMIPSIPYKPLATELQSGDLILFMTDGMTEPRNAEGVMYKESGRFHDVISELLDELSREVVESIIQDVINDMVDEEERMTTSCW